MGGGARVVLPLAVLALLAGAVVVAALRQGAEQEAEAPRPEVAAVGLSPAGLAVAPATDTITITITEEMVERMAATHPELLWKRTPEEGRRALIDALVDEEVLVAEAYARGFHVGDQVIRHRLLDRMYRTLATEPPEPTPEQLRELYELQKRRFERPGSITFEHVFFEDGSAGDIERVLESLRGGAGRDRLGDRFWLGGELEAYSRDQIVRLLGDGFATEVFAVAPGGWHGPVTSARGDHLVRVTERRDTEIPTFEDIETQVREQWKMNTRRMTTAQKMADRRSRYRIVLPPEPGG